MANTISERKYKSLIKEIRDIKDEFTIQLLLIRDDLRKQKLDKKKVISRIEHMEKYL